MEVSERLSRERATRRLYTRIALATLCLLGGFVAILAARRLELGMTATYVAIVAGVLLAWLELTVRPLRRLWAAMIQRFDAVEARLNPFEQILLWAVGWILIGGIVWLR